MTIDEAIKRSEEVMVENMEKTKGRNASDPIAINCFECAEEYRQLAEWLKDYKRLLEQEPKYCDRDICIKNEYNGIGCDECEVTKSQEPTDENLHREREQAYIQGYEDAISRNEALSVFRPRGITEDVWKECDIYKKLTALPSVTPQPKYGKWIVDLQTATEDFYICSECGRRIHLLYPDTVNNYPYCHCGAKMTESED